MNRSLERSIYSMMYILSISIQNCDWQKVCFVLRFFTSFEILYIIWDSLHNLRFSTSFEIIYIILDAFLILTFWYVSMYRIAKVLPHLYLARSIFDILSISIQNNEWQFYFHAIAFLIQGEQKGAWSFFRKSGNPCPQYIIENGLWAPCIPWSFFFFDESTKCNLTKFLGLMALDFW